MRTLIIEHRKCGERKPGGVYAVSPEAAPGGWLLLFSECHPPVPYPVKVHRTPRLVDAEKLLAREPQDSWWMDGSARTEEKKAGDAFFLDAFGMSLAKRLRTGECLGCTDASEALAALAAKIQLHPEDGRIGRLFQEMSRLGFSEIGRVSAHHTVFHRCLTDYLTGGRLADLMSAQAAVWRMAYALPPRKWNECIPTLVRFLVLMNLSKDARALQNMNKENRDNGKKEEVP